MQYRTLEEYKEEVFDKLDEQTKLEWLYEMSEKLCNIEEYILKLQENEDIEIWRENGYWAYILHLVGGDDND